MSKQLNEEYYSKYLKYKQKYLQLKKQLNKNMVNTSVQYKGNSVEQTNNLFGGRIKQNKSKQSKQSKQNKFVKKLNKKNTSRSNTNSIKQLQYKQMESKQLTNEINKTNETKKHNYSKHLSEPWFSLVSVGLKTVEGRLNKGDFAKMKVGDIIEWHNEDFLPRSVLTEITETVNYPSFTVYLETEGLDKCLPGMPSLEHGLSVYYKYFSKEDESTYGINAIKLKVIKY